MSSLVQSSFPYGQWWKAEHLFKRLMPAVILLVYWALHVCMGGFHLHHLNVALIVLLYYAGPRLRPYYEFFLPFFVYITIYDFHSYFILDFRGSIRVDEVYQMEKVLFGIHAPQGVMIPNEWIQQYTNTALDLILSFAYILFVPAYLTLSFLMRFFHGRKGEVFQRAGMAMMWTMFWVAMLSCATYFLYPAAPPWYVQDYGVGPANPLALPSAGGALRADQFLGITLFHDFYAKSPNVFGAIPSMHIAFPVMASYFAFRTKVLRVPSLIFFVLIFSGAVYLNHHYIVDLIWGAAYALMMSIVMDFQMLRPFLQSERTQT